MFITEVIHMTQKLIGSLKLYPGTAPTASKGVLYYNSAADLIKVCTDGSNFVNVLADTGGSVSITQTTTTGKSFAVLRNQATGNGCLVEFQNASATSTQPVLNCYQLGNQNAGNFAIWNNGGYAALTTTDNTGGGAAGSRSYTYFQNTSDGDRKAIYCFRDFGSSSTGNYVVHVQNYGGTGGTDDQGCLKLDHYGASTGNSSYTIYANNQCNGNCIYALNSSTFWGNYSAYPGASTINVAENYATWGASRRISYINGSNSIMFDTNHNIGTPTQTDTNVTFPAAFKTGMYYCANYNGTNAKTVYSADNWYANDWGISFWLYPAAAGGRTILDICPTSSNANRIIINFTAAQKIQVMVYDSGGTNLKDYTGSTTLTLSTAYMVSIAWNGTALRFYINAVEETYTKNTDNSVTQTATSRVLKIGTNYAESVWYSGQIDDIRFWNLNNAVNQPTGDFNFVYQNGTGTKFSGPEPSMFYLYQRKINSNTAMIYAEDSSLGSNTTTMSLMVPVINLSSIATFTFIRNANTSGHPAGAVMMVSNGGSVDNKSALSLAQTSTTATGACLELWQNATGANVIYFNTVSTQGTGHTSIAGSFKVNFNGNNYYMNVYS
jgi:hypothetical protein